MNATPVLTIEDPIELRTDLGPFEAQHFSYGSEEGIALKRHIDSHEPLLVRLHSSCVFSESLGSIDCDCSLQLRAALGIVAEEGGLVAYFYQEGRGAGLRAKMRAIRLQQKKNVDTATAFECLGLPPDPRVFTSAAAVIDAILGRDREVVLLTNNPRKSSELKRLGVKVVGSRPLVVAPTDDVRQYLQEKARVLGHQIDLA